MLRAATLTRSRSKSRSGITLVEILISILIMGIGVISIATLFPLGLLRLRNAQRLTRGTYLQDSAAADLGSRNLLAASSFVVTVPANNPVQPPTYLQSPYSPWYFTGTSGTFNPLYQDTPAYGSDWLVPANGFGLPAGANRYIPGTTTLLGTGLPFAYDPLWRAVTGSYPNNVAGTGFEGRFGSGIGLVRADPGGNPAHAYGLQRLSNYQASLSGAGISMQTASAAQMIQNNVTVLGTFVSPEDLVLQDPKGSYLDPNGLYPQLQGPSTVVPAMSDSPRGPTFVSPVSDWRYTWLFTGMQTDPSSTAVDGQIVVCENRPFAIDNINGVSQPSGETVVEAIWGFSSSPNYITMLAASTGYGSLSASRSVYLRWPSTQSDPDIRTGGWIADVTYERVDAIARTHYGANANGSVNGLYPAQRCYWYQIAKKTDINVDTTTPGFRGVTLWTTTPLQAMTLQTFNPGSPAVPLHREACLIMPSVINVYPRTVYTR